MRLIRKLTAALVLGMCAVLVAFGYISARLEGMFFEGELRRHEEIVGRALGVPVAEAWRVSGAARALELIETADRNEPDLRIRWVWLDSPAGDPFHPGPEPGGRRTLDWRDITYVPVQVPGSRAGGLEISESLEPEDRHVHAILVRTAVTMVALAVVSGVLAALLGGLMVGRRVESLVAKARRIGQGDLADPLLLRGGDELGDLAQELNATCAALAEARESVEAAHTARIGAIEQLRHADRLNTVGKLASGIAHELGTPMNVVRGRAMMIASGEVTGGEAADNGRIIAAQIDRMSVIIRSLLDFAKRRRPEKAPADLAALATQTLALLEPLAKKRGVQLRLTSSAAGGLVAVNVGQIQQALTNLVMNAVQASRRGDAVEVATGREVVCPPPSHGGPEAPYATLAVVDRGEGISADHLPHLFEPFFTTRDVGEGTGLGLPVSFGIVNDHGGWIAVDSRVDWGSRFTIYLPLDEHAAPNRPR